MLVHVCTIIFSSIIKFSTYNENIQRNSHGICKSLVHQELNKFSIDRRNFCQNQGNQTGVMPEYSDCLINEESGKKSKIFTEGI